MKTLISEEQIQARLRELAGRVNRDYASESLTILGVLVGSLMLLADLVRRIERPTRIGFLRASSYRGATTRPDLLPDIHGRHVLVLDDILDSGQTLNQTLAYLKKLGPKSIRSGVLLRKQGRQNVQLEPDYVGFEIPDEFVVGYGLDYNDEYRQLPYIAVLEPGDHHS
jgi:hypoxanthine phosphoribosyltransferase